MKRIYSFITSLPFMAFLFLAAGFVMAIATFVESSYGTAAAGAIIYHAWWFELLLALFALNLINNIFRFRLFSRRKFTMGIFHLSFLLILLGAAITRYISYEGIMHIREGESVDEIISSEDYFYASYQGEKIQKRVIFSELAPRQFSKKINANGDKVTIKSIGYIKNAERKPIPSENGEALIDFVFSTPGVQGMQTHILNRGGRINIPGFSIVFGKGREAAINFFNEGDSLFMTSVFSIEELSMGSRDKIIFMAGDTIPVKKMFLYGFGDYRFLIRNYYESAVLTAVRSQHGETGEDAVIVKVADSGGEKVVAVFGHPGIVGDTTTVALAKGNLKMVYGSIPKKIPFEIYLKEFQLEKYPWSNSPSSYASEVVLRDKSVGLEKDVRIFMNSTLTYKGFKFFQSSYDQDELGTVLSVNHDLWGTWVTYAGYFLLIFGIILSLFNPNSYFRSIAKRLKDSKIAMVLLVAFFIGSGNSIHAQESSLGAGLPDIDKQVVDEFKQLWVQGPDGRVEPVSTLASEVVRKISRKASLYGKSPDEVVLSFIAWPDLWQSLPIIKVSNKTVAAELGITGKYISIRQLFDEHGQYKIAEKVRSAYNKAPALRGKVEKEYIYVDERVNICFMLFRGSLLNLFPGAKIETPWYAFGSSVVDIPESDSLFVKGGFQILAQALTKQNKEEALQVIRAIARLQEKFGGSILPSESKKKIEILYNQVNIFKRVFPFYLIFGFLLLGVLFLNIFRQKQVSVYITRGIYFFIMLCFLGHSLGLVARYYITGHAPWSNGFESIVYVAWAAMLAGLILGRKYIIVVGTASFLAGIALLVAHMSWMNPEVTNLAPVLKSYWLTIHVAVITASYGFIGLSAFLGVLVLILIVLRNENNVKKVGNIIEQLTSINELSAMIGLYFLIIGTFLGAIWANESWGRYWGWDPKETWSLITVAVYSFIVHMRLIPSLKGVFNFNVASVIGLASVLMTYFGVNYYLSGLHSYGSGMANGIHWAVQVSLLCLAGLMVLAWIKDNQFEKQKTS